MAEKETFSNHTNKLRQQAEEKAARMAENLATLFPEETRQMFHELHVHQIEMEMQNAELRSAQAKLDVARARYFDLFDLAPVGYFTTSEEGLILEANLTAASLLGMVREALVKQPITRFILKKDQDIYYLYRKHLFEAHSADSGQTALPRACELRMVKKDGTPFWARMEAIAVQENDGAPVCRAAISDITGRKQAEEKIQRNESLLRKLLDILQHPSGTIQDFLDYALNQAIQLTESKIGFIYHYHENRQEFVLNTWSRDVMAECAIANPPTCYELEKTGIWGEAVRQRRPIIINDFQAANILKKGYPEGHVHLFKFITVPIFKEDRIVGVIGLANKENDYDESDILQVSLLMETVWKVTERIRAEESLRESEESLRTLLSEKEVLLKEIHHRVKNNLQVIFSLISLQADSVADSRLREGLRDVRDRVHTIALVHEMLYQTDDLTQLDFPEYAGRLLQYLWRSHGAAAEKVRLNQSFAPLMLPVETAAHCGLILNELVRNAIKHAFHSGTECEFFVALEHDPETGTVCLKVSDNGVGLPADLEWRQSETLGLRLVQMLVAQMHGTVQNDPGPGTKFQINFTV
ncbi:MAG: GAF domain-containing protein [Desulfatirhabdiaceae bacterium]